MVDWTSGLADASVAERDSGFVVVRIPGTPDVLKEAPVNGFVTKDANGNVGIGGPATSLLHIKSTNATVLTVESTNLSAGDTQIRILTPDRDWRIQNIGGIGIGAFAIYDFTAGAYRFVIDSVGVVRPGADNTQPFGAPSFRWTTLYATTGAINTSDEREKTDIGEIPEAWLDAWADVEWRRFKFVDRVRWHIGLVAQQVHAAFAAHDIDAFEIGLCCYDEWEEEREPIFESVTKTRKTLTTQYVEAGVNENGQTLFIAQDVEIDEEYQESVDTGKTKVTKPAGDRWGLRENECQAIEAAYKRRELSRMESRLALLEGAKS
jgi:hypothetical protein